MLYVPRHLPNKLEYKVLSCISVHYQSRMTSNEIASTPSRLHSAGRAMVLFKTNMLGGRGVSRSSSGVIIVDLVNIVMYVDSSMDFLWLCCGYWARRPSNLEAFCKRPRGGRSAFYYKQGVQVSGGKVSVDLHWHGIPPCTAIVFMQEPVGGVVVLVWVSRYA